MFSGLIAYCGTVESFARSSNGDATLRLRAEGIANERPHSKDSIAVNGVCLTVTNIEGDILSFDVVPETLARSTLGALHPNDRVNLEYALRVGDRVGGHFVYGHVDIVSSILARTEEGQGERVRIERPRSIAPMIVDKAFVAVDGVSLTVAATGSGWFEVALIPETLAGTTLGALPVSGAVNLEADPIARYVASMFKRAR